MSECWNVGDVGLVGCVRVLEYRRDVASTLMLRPRSTESGVLNFGGRNGLRENEQERE